MLADDKQIRGLRLPNTLQVSPSNTATMVGYMLRSLYADTFEEAHPPHLTSLIERMDAAERAAMQSSRR